MIDNCRDIENMTVIPPGYGSVVYRELPEVGIENLVYILEDDNGVTDIMIWDGNAYKSICEGGDTPPVPPTPPTPTPEVDDNIYIDSDVLFIDYDGTILHNYSSEEFLALNELPENPSHEGLTAQGWNWTLDEAKAYVRKHGMVDIGQTYITDNGETRIYISLDDVSKLKVPLIMGQSVVNTATIDWGDGTQEETSATSTSSTTYYHTYPTTGDYVIRIMVSDGTVNFGTSNAGLMGQTSASEGYTRDIVKKIEIGTGIGGFTQSAVFEYMTSLETITLPIGQRIAAQYALGMCYKLKAIVIPRGVTNGGGYTFQADTNLKSAVLPGDYSSNIVTNMFYQSGLRRAVVPDGVMTVAQNAFASCQSLLRASTRRVGTSCFTSSSIVKADITDIVSINNSAFSYAWRLREIVIPATCTQIQTSAFAYAYSLARIYVMATTPPSLQTTAIFSSIHPDYVIYVPKGSLDTYLAATNWSALASHMREME